MPDPLVNVDENKLCKFQVVVGLGRGMRSTEDLLVNVLFPLSVSLVLCKKLCSPIVNYKCWAWS